MSLFSLRLILEMYWISKSVVLENNRRGRYNGCMSKLKVPDRIFLDRDFQLHFYIIRNFLFSKIVWLTGTDLEFFTLINVFANLLDLYLIWFICLPGTVHCRHRGLTNCK